MVRRGILGFRRCRECKQLYLELCGDKNNYVDIPYFSKSSLGIDRNVTHLHTSRSSLVNQDDCSTAHPPVLATS